MELVKIFKNFNTIKFMNEWENFIKYESSWI